MLPNASHTCLQSLLFPLSVPFTVAGTNCQTPPSSGGNTCAISLKCNSKWSGGSATTDYYHFNLYISSTTTVLNGWTVSFAVPAGAKLQQVWGGAKIADDGAKSRKVRLNNEEWAKSLPVNIGGIVSGSMAFSDFVHDGDGDTCSAVTKFDTCSTLG